MDDKVVFLRSSDVTPEAVLRAVETELEHLKTVYIVGIQKDGEPICWASGDLSSLAFASLVLQNLALKSLNGLILDE